MKIYPPDEEYKYPHYKNGFKAWSSYPLLDRISFVASCVALAISLVALVSSL